MNEQTFVADSYVTRDGGARYTVVTDFTGPRVERMRYVDTLTPDKFRAMILEKISEVLKPDSTPITKGPVMNTTIDRPRPLTEAEAKTARYITETSKTQYADACDLVRYGALDSAGRLALQNFEADEEIEVLKYSASRTMFEVDHGTLAQQAAQSARERVEKYRAEGKDRSYHAVLDEERVKVGLQPHNPN